MTTTDTIFSELTTKCDEQAVAITKLATDLTNTKSQLEGWKRSYDSSVKYAQSDRDSFYKETQALRTQHAKEIEAVKETAVKACQALVAEAKKMHQETIVAAELEMERCKNDTLKQCFDRLLDKLTE